MGGIAFLLAIFVTGLLFVPGHPRILPVLLMTVGFGVIGFTDDYIKIVRKHSEGLNPKQKLAAQIVLTALFCVYMMRYSGFGTTIRIPFAGVEWNMGWLYVPFLFLVVLGTDNGVILENHARLMARGADVLVRTPLIPGYTATAENIRAIAHYLANADPDAKYELLNFNPLCRSKYAALERDYPVAGAALSAAEMDGYYDILRQEGIRHIIRE